jgi:hypothetical protein
VEGEGVPWDWRRGGRGRKLQEPGVRWETRVKISEMRRCWTLVSYGFIIKPVNTWDAK